VTGHIPGATVLRASSKHAQPTGAGANHAGLRAANERLILSLIRKHGQLSKAQMAELSGLAMQTASVISRSLIEAGLLSVGELVRGKVGQPYTPLRLNPDGALFLGVHVGPTDMQAAFVDFTGNIVSEHRVGSSKPDLDLLVRFVMDTANQVRNGQDADRRARFQGIGVSIASSDTASGNAPFDRQALADAFDQVAKSIDLSVQVTSDAVAACSAELIYGLGSGVQDFLYVFLDRSVSGGLVQASRIRFSSNERGPNLGKMLVPDGLGKTTALHQLALAEGDEEAPAPFISRLAKGVAHAVAAVAAVVRCDTVVVDGSLAPDIQRKVIVDLRAELARLDMVEANRISVREGSSSRKSLALGAACLPLADRYYPSEPDLSEST
jgi:predicted NBD/HSP70 family sugar kinase